MGDRREGQRRGWFLAGLALAHVGVFIGMAPLLHILVPLKAQVIAPETKETVLSIAAFYGAATAAISNILSGALSDRTRSRWGRRKPWLVMGALGVIVSYWVIASADRAWLLIAGVILFQATYNMMLAALLALFAEQAPERSRGMMSAVFGLSYPLANMLGALIIGGLLTSDAARYSVLAVVIIATVAPLALLAPVPPALERLESAAPVRPMSLTLGPFARRDFLLAWVGRFLTTFGFVLVSIYLLYFIDKDLIIQGGLAGRRAEAVLSILATLSFVGVVGVSLAVVVTPRLAARRRTLLLFGMGFLAAAAAGLAVARGWPAVAAIFTVYGLGMGCYFAVEMALMADVLPTAQHKGRDLGLLNLAAVLPQATAPLAALAMVAGLGLDYRALFAAAGAVFLCAGCVFAALRRRAGV